MFDFCVLIKRQSWRYTETTMMPNNGFTNHNSINVNAVISRQTELLSEVKSLELIYSYFARLLEVIDERDTVLDSLKLFLIYFAMYSDSFPIIDKKRFVEFICLLAPLSKNKFYQKYLAMLITTNRKKINLESYLFFFPSVFRIIKLIN